MDVLTTPFELHRKTPFKDWPLPQTAKQVKSLAFPRLKVHDMEGCNMVPLVPLVRFLNAVKQTSNAIFSTAMSVGYTIKKFASVTKDNN